jgi:NADH:ubiquinone oxidoreductase subunit H
VIGVGMALVWFGVLSLALVGCAMVERWSRLVRLQDRPEWGPPRRDWGFDAQPPPATYLLVRALAAGARLVRSRSVVSDRSPSLAFFGRLVSIIALASALVLVPFAGTFGGTRDGIALVCVDMRYGLLSLVFLFFLMTLAQVAVGLADRQIWSRLGSVRLASRNLSGLGLLMIVLAPLALETSSLRLHDIVFVQQETFAPFSWLPAPVGGEVFEIARSWRWPNWNLFAQPLTALLFIPTMENLVRRPLVQDATAGILGTSGFGIDDDPIGLYWTRFEARLARVLGAALFVSFFLGAGAIPFVPASAIVDLLQPLMGFGLPAVLGVAIQVGVFLVKLLCVLAGISFMRRATAVIRDDQWIGIVTLRLFPLAWANLLLMSAMTLLSDSIQGGV